MSSIINVLACSEVIPAIVPQKVDKVDRRQAGIQVLHVHQNSKGNATGKVLLLLYQDDGPQQETCIHKDALCVTRTDHAR